MKSHYLILMFVLLIASHVQGQVVIGPVDGVDPEARLDIRTGSESSGMMIPRVNNFPSGSIAQGMMVFYTGSNFDQSLYVYVDNTWQQLAESAGLDITAPSAPTSLTASNPTTSSIDLSWTASTANDVTGYYIYFSDTTLAATVTSGTSTTIAGLSHGTLYTFYATAFDAAGNESSSSNNASETTTTPPPVIINEGYFETGNDDWVDYGRSERNNSSEYSCEQDWSMRIRDDRTGSRIELLNKDLTTYNLVTINFEYKTTNNWEPDDRFELKLNNIVIGTWDKSESCTSVSISIDSSDYTFGSQDDFKFEGEMDHKREIVYIDAVVIKGYIAP